MDVETFVEAMLVLALDDDGDNDSDLDEIDLQGRELEERLLTGVGD